MNGRRSGISAIFCLEDEGAATGISDEGDGEGMRLTSEVFINVNEGWGNQNS